MFLASCSAFGLISIFTSQRKWVCARFVNNIKVIVSRVQVFNYFVHYFLFIDPWYIKRIVLFKSFSDVKLNFPAIRAETLSIAICSSLFFILFFGCVSFLDFLFCLSLGCIGACLTNATSSSFFFLSPWLICP